MGLQEAEAQAEALLTEDCTKAGALSLLSVTVRMTLATPVKPLPAMSVAWTSRTYCGYFCDRRDVLRRPHVLSWTFS